MQVNSFSNNICSLNKCSKPSLITFGEIGGDDVCYLNENRKPKDSYYYIKMDEINEKYNKQRFDMYRRLGISNLWEQLDKIEKARTAE